MSCNLKYKVEITEAMGRIHGREKDIICSFVVGRIIACLTDHINPLLLEIESKGVILNDVKEVGWVVVKW